MYILVYIKFMDQFKMEKDDLLIKPIMYSIMHEVSRAGAEPERLSGEIRFGEDSWFSIRASLGEAYEPGSLNQVTIYASLKFEGLAFYPEDEEKTDRVLCDRVIVVRKPDLETE